MLDDENIVPPHRKSYQSLTPAQAEALAIRLILDLDPVALAAHTLGLASRAEQKPVHLHPDTVGLMVRQIIAQLLLAEQSAAVVRAVRKAAQRNTGTAYGDRTAAGRDDDPFPIHTHEELNDLEKRRKAE